MGGLNFRSKTGKTYAPLRNSLWCDQPDDKQDQQKMALSVTSLFNWIYELSIEKRIPENVSAFRSEITYVNLIRLRIMSAVACILFLLLLIWDVVQFFGGKWRLSIGYSIIAYSHIILIALTAGIYIFCRIKTPQKAALITNIHIAFSNCALALGLFCTIFLSLGDVLSYGSIAAYLGMVFALAAIFVMTNRYSFLLYIASMLLMVTLLVIVSNRLNRPMNIQIINTVAFTITAFVLSRIMFFYHLKDFINRLLLNKQAVEIGKQNEVKEQLIQELSSALTEVKTLGGLLPICANCKKIRNDQGYWTHVELYIAQHSDAQFSHGICDECSDKLYGDQPWYQKKKQEREPDNPTKPPSESLRE